MDDERMDDRMDERLHEYAGRWRAGDTAAPAALGGVPARRRSVLLPALTAAAVVATVVGVGLAQRDDPSRLPPAGPTASPTTDLPATPCVQDWTAPTMRWSAGFNFAADHHITGNLDGELRLTNIGSRRCVAPDDVRITVRFGVTDIGVPFEDTPASDAVRTIDPATALVKPLSWKAAVPLCGKEPIVVVLLIEAGGEAFRLPVDRHVFPPCRDREHRATGRIHADSWSRLAVAAPCAMDEWAAQAHLEPLDVLKHEGTGTERRGIQITVDLVNDAGRPCDINVKPMFYVVANGRRLPMSRFMSSGGRLGPPLGPGRRARAELFWSSYCGPALDDYEIYVEIPGRPGAEPMTTTGGKPLPECQRDPDDPDSAGQTSGEWIEAS